MKKIQNLIRRFFPPATPLKAGHFHYQAPPESNIPLRLFLRIEPGGDGLLIINASTVLHLNQTAAEYVFHIVNQTPESEIGKIFASRYSISQEQADLDFKEIKDKIASLIQTPDLDPVTFLDIDQASLYSGVSSAPYRLDCALTYHQMDAPDHVAPMDRVQQELDLPAWQRILDKTSQAGIPHIIFTGGEPTTRADLVQLIAYAEKLGLVTGLLTNGLRFSEADYFHQILQSGLDHVMILLDPTNPTSWQVIKTVLSEDISLTVHLTLTADNIAEVSEIIQRLSLDGAQKISLSASQSELKDALLLAQKQVAESGMSLVWDLPVPYSIFNPINLAHESDEDAPQGAGKAWLYVEPDGDVLPGQGVGFILGNLANDSWESIWSNRLQ